MGGTRVSLDGVTNAWRGHFDGVWMRVDMLWRLGGIKGVGEAMFQRSQLGTNAGRISGQVEDVWLCKVNS